MSVSFSRGGFRLIPHTIEFYQGQSNRLSDRIQFRRLLSEADKKIPVDPDVTHQGTHGWVFERLSP
jgi:pyridoxamine 5'-phosphate oxidase